jgi:hypothetical protein
MITSLHSHTFFFFEKLIFPTMSKIVEFGLQTEEILGVNQVDHMQPKSHP